jgi:hypothetical protein
MTDTRVCSQCGHVLEHHEHAIFGRMVTVYAAGRPVMRTFAPTSATFHGFEDSGRRMSLSAAQDDADTIGREADRA